MEKKVEPVQEVEEQSTDSPVAPPKRKHNYPATRRPPRKADEKPRPFEERYAELLGQVRRPDPALERLHEQQAQLASAVADMQAQLEFVAKKTSKLYLLKKHKANTPAPAAPAPAPAPKQTNPLILDQLFKNMQRR